MANKDFTSLNDLFAHIESRAQSTLKNEIAKEVVETMREHVQSDVYDVYDPVYYERTGKLLTDIDVEVIDDNTIAVENVRYEDGKDIAAIVESGQGYTYDFPYNGVPRPFTENTYEELKSSNKLQNAMIKGMRKRGINVQ